MSNKQKRLDPPPAARRVIIRPGLEENLQSSISPSPLSSSLVSDLAEENQTKKGSVYSSQNFFLSKAVSSKQKIAQEILSYFHVPKEQEEVKKLLLAILPLVDVDNSGNVIYSNGVLGSDLYSLIKYFVTRKFAPTVFRKIKARPWDVTMFSDFVLIPAGVKYTFWEQLYNNDDDDYVESISFAILSPQRSKQYTTQSE